jgi:hypothetical protein
MNKNATTWSIVTLVVIFLATIAANILGFQANTDTGNIANETFNNANYFFPATYVFTTIWPVIYTGILGWAVYQALPANRENPRFRAAAPWLMVNLILNGLWVWVFGMEAFVSTLPIMFALVYTGVMAYSKLQIGQVQVGRWERILQIPISIYLAWLTVATVANIASALIAADWNGFGLSYLTWGVIMLLVAAALAVFLYRTFYSDVVFLLVYLYAYIGIIVRYNSVSQILIAAAAGALVVGGLAIFHFSGRKGQPSLQAS